MADQRFLQLGTELFLALFLLVPPGHCEPDNSTKIDAAMNLRSSTLFFKDNLVMFFMREEAVQVTTLVDSGLTLPDGFRIQAAWMDEESYSFFFYGPSYAMRISPQSETQKIKRLRYGPRRAFIRDGGPDAAGFMEGKLYFFKGCQMVVRKSWYTWTKPQSMEEVGLPCPVDAAWEHYNTTGTLVLYKEGLIWKWNGSGVDGPIDVEDEFTLRPWVLPDRN